MKHDNNPININKKILSFLFITLVLLISLSTQVFALTYGIGIPIILDGDDTVGWNSSMQMVNGNPAVSYWDIENRNLKFIRATSTDGSTWGYSQTIDNSDIVGQFTSLAIINGNPAVSYFDIMNSDLKFVRATNADGSSWAAPVTVDSDGYVGQCSSLALVDGVPAISYYDADNTSLKFVHATSLNGSSWAMPITLDNDGDVGDDNSLAMINGTPAISYYDSTNYSLKFIRATAPDGTSWRPPQTIDNNGNVGDYSSLALVDGTPAISYYDISNTSLKFIRATDAVGTAWNTPITLDNTADVGKHSSLAIVDGYPVISYYDKTNRNLKVVCATSPDGSTWDTPITLDSDGRVGEYNSLIDMNGNIAVSYYDSSHFNLKFIALQSYDISVLDGATLLASGDSFDYGTTSITNSLSHTFTIRNNGNSKLDITHLSLPSGYSFTGSIPTSIDAKSTEDITVRLEAIQNGSFTGNLQIESNDSEQSPYTIALTGTVTDTHGEIALFDGTTEIADGTGSFDYGSTTVGTPISHTFTVENTSMEDLNLYSLSLPTGFSLQGTYNSTVPASGSTSITVRLDAISVGTYSGQFSLANNDADENPFNFTISGEVLSTSGEITMFDGPTGIADGETTPIDFGTTALGTPVSRTFTIQNLGSNALDIYALTLPSGFSLQGTYNHVVAPSGSTAITVQLDASFVGSYSGEFSLANDDADENPFNFAISGEVNNTALETDIIVPLNGSTVLESGIQVAFNHDVLHDGSAEAADNPVNYLLVEDGTNGLFDTSTCLAGVAGDDIQQTITSVTYNTSTFIATLNTDPLPGGHYQLLVCGTASIEDASGNILNGGAFDSVTAFTVVSASGSGSGSTASATALLPATGFTPDTQTSLPAQPANLAYNDMDSLSLQIPSLKVDVPIVGVPQNNTGWDVTWLTNGQAGWLNGTAYPTWDGNTVLTGHVTNASGNPGPFANIKTLKFGDQITIQAYGETYTYEVRENKLVTSDNMSIIEEHKSRDWVTLITCEYFNETTGQYLYRRVVRAVLVEVE
jgi:LPXTG-site transpeptidase (sortase) family protein